MASKRPVRPVLRLWSWLLLSHLIVLVLPIFILVFSGALGADQKAQTLDDLGNQAALIGMLSVHELRHARERNPRAGLDDVADRLGPSMHLVRSATLASVRVLDERGVVIATSGEELGKDLSDQPEVAEALAGGTGVMERDRRRIPSQPLSSKSRRARVYLFLARPIEMDGKLVGAVVLSRTPREEVQALYHMFPLWGAAIAGAITLGVAMIAGTVFTRSLRDLAVRARKVAQGSVDGLASMEQRNYSHVREVSELSAAFSTMAGRLQERMAYISEFAGNVSHEFKTPIATLRGTVELLRDDVDMAPAQRSRFLDNALDDLSRMNRLVAGLLDLARAEERGEVQEVPLADVMRQVSELYPEIRVEGKAGTIRGNRPQIESVLINLVDNALRYGAGPVVLRGWEDGALTGVEVEDAGTGISAANQTKVFERFFTTHRATGGTGLGLALARAICRAHGGSLTLESVPGQTVFRVSLPREFADLS